MQLADFEAANNLVQLFLDRADELGDAPFLFAKHKGDWHALTWREAAGHVCRIAESLRALGLEDGDRVVLVSENRPEWCLADLAIMAAGCITVPAYTTNTERDHRHILTDSGARAAIVSNPALAGPLLAAAADCPLLEHVIGIELDDAQGPSFAFHPWADLLAGEETTARQAVAARLAAIGRRDTACIIYTSGTGGTPRGVILSHGAILANVDGAATVLVTDYGWEVHRFLSFLPLSHAYEHTAGQFLPIGMGAEIWYAQNLEKLAANIAEVKPTFMVVVPRLFEMLRTKIIREVCRQGRIARWLMDQALALGERQTEGRQRPGDRLLDKVLDRTLRPRIRHRFGGRIHALVSGGAPLNTEVGRFFQALGITVLQGYGQTEAAPVISCNYPSAGIRLDTVGPPLKGTKVRIAEDGEILVRGEVVMKGYWNNPQETAHALRDGWLHTGDVGHLDDGGRIVITDRKKDIIVNDKGDNVAPQKIEGMLTLQPEIGQAMVHGDRKPYVVALVVPDAEWAFEWAQAANEPFDLTHLQHLPPFRSAIRSAVDRMNEDVPVTEKVRQFAFADEPFTIENEELTPSLKIRRHKLRERYADRLERLYKA
ncbi:AMP-dependent synthetase/ligase [Altericroceibacterium xinjiangense]|uniref:AMP-dependent synthetase/ligase n=1 Tax=Altericroceibacterium xinjiangense TaxID=762261 RepID=UPI000F7F2CD8|nr:long-chain fatty acid--CoA ligase [Altericroceibacterium xinjiangense]